MAWIWTSLAFVALIFLLRWLSTENRRLPPGPRGFPIFGSLHLLGKFPHRALHQLAQRYGPIMHLRLGQVPAIVVSSPEAAELFLKTHDLVFSGRPPRESARYISYGQKGMAFAQYGSYWRSMRKMCTVELLSSLKVASFKAMRMEEVDLLIKYIQEASQERVAVDLSAKVSSLSADMSCRMVFGKKYLDDDLDERGFKSVMQEVMHLSGAPHLGDYIPQIAALDLQGLTKRMKAISKVLDAFLDRIVDEHVHYQEKGKNKDFVDVMLSFMKSEENEYLVDQGCMKAIMLDMLVGSVDTSATVIDWAFSELIKNPRVMKKLQKELEEVVGKQRMVEESDLERLEYLDMVVKETLRLHPAGPLMIPHEATEDCVVNGFHIPKKSHVIINVWAIGRDPEAWTDAEKFYPERFVGSDIDIRGRDFQLIPFGTGRRSCPGMQLGLTVVRLVVAQLLHCFDWELPNGILPSEVDMTEEFGLVLCRSKHLVAIPTYRLNK
ncbi:cytochrome P450 71AU50-like [Populus alba x Populus x berolinensis]|nr:cytochrome P450 71AU50-like [Populus alba x Populus x berolinensis]